MDVNMDTYYASVVLPFSAKPIFFKTTIANLTKGDDVVVQTSTGPYLGKVHGAPIANFSLESGETAFDSILRRADEEDYKSHDLALKEADEALIITKEHVEKLGLDMRLLDAYYSLDGAYVTIYFASDNRVDFRELLRVLAPLLKARIDLRHVMARDRAKKIGGIGICGLPLCCSTFLTKFDAISITRAKNQMLTLNIPKLSGHCGKLLCCLLFEDDLYTEGKRNSRASVR